MAKVDAAAGREPAERLTSRSRDGVRRLAGLAIAERDVEPSEIGGSPRHLPDIVLGVVRNGKLFRVDAAEADAIESGDRLLHIKKATPPDES